MKKNESTGVVFCLSAFWILQLSHIWRQSIPLSHLSLLPADRNIISPIHKMHLRDIGNVWKWKMQPQSNLVQSLKDVPYLFPIRHQEKIRFTQIWRKTWKERNKNISLTLVFMNES